MHVDLQGMVAEATQVPSPNCDSRPSGVLPELLVVHCISLPPGKFGGGEISALFTNTLDWESHPYFQQIKGLEVSSHFVIRRDGALLQFVSASDRAWHAGASHYQIGRAHV